MVAELGHPTFFFKFLSQDLQIRQDPEIGCWDLEIGSRGLEMGNPDLEITFSGSRYLDIL